MIRKIIVIDEEKCNGCGLCADACHEGAIGMVAGKAKLLREDYCDGLGDCLPACPVNAISFEEREAPAYNEAAVLAAKKAKEAPLPCGCPGSACQSIQPAASEEKISVPNQLTNFPVQIKLLPPNAPYFDGADLLIAADCTAYAYGNFHHDFMQGKVTMIGCPKLDAVQYSEKLTQIFRLNDVKSVTVTRMTVPCCGGLTYAVETAIANSGKHIPLHNQNLLTLDFWKDTVTYAGHTLPTGSIGCAAMNISDEQIGQLIQLSAPLAMVIALINDGIPATEHFAAAKNNVLKITQMIRSIHPFSLFEFPADGHGIQQIFSDEYIENALAYIQAAQTIGASVAMDEQYKKGIGVIKLISVPAQLGSKQASVPFSAE